MPYVIYRPTGCRYSTTTGGPEGLFTLGAVAGTIYGVCCALSYVALSIVTVLGTVAGITLGSAWTAFGLWVGLSGMAALVTTAIVKALLWKNRGASTTSPCRSHFFRIIVRLLFPGGGGGDGGGWPLFFLLWLFYFCLIAVIALLMAHKHWLPLVLFATAGVISIILGIQKIRKLLLKPAVS